MLVAYLGFVLILQARFIAGYGNQVYELPGGGKVVVVTSYQDSNSKPEHKHRDRYPDGINVIRLGGDNGYNQDKDRNSDFPDEVWDFLKQQNITRDQFPSGFQVIQFGGDNYPKRKQSHDDDDDDDDDVLLRKIFKRLRYAFRRGDRRSNGQFLNLQGRDLGNRQQLPQDRSDYNYPVANSQADVPRTRVKIVRQNVPRRMMVRNLRASQAHLTNMQTLSFPVYEDEWQVA